MVSSLGLGSGLPLADLVSQLIAAEGATESQRIFREETRMQSEISALGDVKGAIADFQGLVSSRILDRDSFHLRTASSSDKDVVEVAASITAQVASHSIRVNTLAKAHTLTTAAYTNKTDVIGSGSITIQYGTDSSPFTINPDKAIEVVNIDSSNNTLEGIRDAINATATGVQASIVNDGSGFKLVVTSNETGAKNSLKILVNDDDLTDTDTAGLSQIAYDPDAGVGAGKNLTQSVAAADSAFVLDGIAITNASNVITDVLEGVTLTLNSVDTVNDKTLNIAIDKTTIRNNVDAVINSFNNIYNSSISSNTAFNADSGETGPLFGDFTVRTIDNQVRNVLTSSIEGLIGPFRALSDLGITTNADGSMSLNTTKFDAALDTGLDDVARVFTAFGQPTDEFVQFSTSSDVTNTGSYVVNVTQVASKGNLVGGAAANTTITTSSNDALEITIDGKNASVVLTAGSYTASELASMVQAQINGHKTFRDNDISVTVTESAGVLTIESASFGSVSGVEITGGNGKTDLVGAAPTVTAGVDVAGTIGGSPANGVGQQLVSTGGDSAGLALNIIGGGIGSRGVVDFTRGVGDQLNTLLTTHLEDDGSLNSRIDNLNTDIASLEDDREALERRLIAFEQRLVNQFSALDQIVSQLSAQGSYLTQQFSILNGIVANGGG